MKLGRDKVRWVRSPCSPEREGWNATGEKSGEYPLETESVSHRVQREQPCMALCSDNSPDVVGIVDPQMGEWGC